MGPKTLLEFWPLYLNLRQDEVTQMLPAVVRRMAAARVPDMYLYTLKHTSPQTLLKAENLKHRLF